MASEIIMDVRAAVMKEIKKVLDELLEYKKETYSQEAKEKQEREMENRAKGIEIGTLTSKDPNAWKNLFYPECKGTWKNATPEKKQEPKTMQPKRVIYNPPATIVIWADGSKTVVKTAPGTEYDPYDGFCAAVTKRVYGTSSAVRKAAGIPKEPKMPKPFTPAEVAVVRASMEAFAPGRTEALEQYNKDQSELATRLQAERIKAQDSPDWYKTHHSQFVEMGNDADIPEKYKIEASERGLPFDSDDEDDIRAHNLDALEP